MDLYSRLAGQFAPKYDLFEVFIGRGREFAEEELDSDGVRLLWERFLEEERKQAIPRKDLHFYVHIPFCKQRCLYCCYYSVPLTQQDCLESYLGWLFGSLSYFSETFRNRQFQTFYIGGGTPSILNAAQLDRLLTVVFRGYSFDEKGERTLECNPFSVTREKLRLMESYGINRISMGVQTFGAESLSLENRGYQSHGLVSRAVSLVQDCGRFVLNLDLLLGLQGDTPEIFLETFRGVMALRPDQITVYPVYPTAKYMKTVHRELRADDYYPDLDRRYGGIIPEIRRLAEKNGYAMGGDLKIDGSAWFFGMSGKGLFSVNYTDVSRTTLSMFGLGPTARSHIAGALSYRQKTSIAGNSFDPRKPIYRARRLDWRDEMAGFILKHLRADRAISGEEFRREFNSDIFSKFPEAIRELEGAGRLARDGDLLRFAGGAKERFVSGLHFLSPLELESMLKMDIVLRINDDSHTFRLSRATAGSKYLAKAAGFGLTLMRQDAALRPDAEAWPRLAALVFHKLAGRQGGMPLPVFVEEYAADLDRLLKQLRDTGRFVRLSLEIAPP